MGDRVKEGHTQLDEANRALLVLLGLMVQLSMVVFKTAQQLMGTLHESNSG